MAAEQAQNWFEKAKVKVEETFNQLNLSNSSMTELGIALGIGFVVGFFLKKMGRPVIILLLVMALGLIALQYAGVITIDWLKIRTVFGMTATEQLNEIAQSWYAWGKVHLMMVISGVVGFLIGYNIG